MTTSLLTRIDVPEALWRVRIMEEIETNGGTLDARQLDILTESLAIIAADGSFRNATPPADVVPVKPTERDASTSKARSKPTVRKLSEKQLYCLRRDLPRHKGTGMAVTTVRELLARCARDGTDPLTIIPMRLASDALSVLFAR